MNKKNLCTTILIILISFLFAKTSVAQTDKVYYIGLNYHSGELILNNVVVIPLNHQKENVQEGYKAELISFNDSVLSSQFFQISTDLHGDYINPETGGIVAQELDSKNQSIFIQIPYYKDGKQINIYAPNNSKILEFSIAYFADVCGDKICEPHENYQSCPKDCPSGGKDGYCDAVRDNICDPDCLTSQDIDCSQQSVKPNILVIIIGSIVILALIFFTIMKRKDPYDILKERRLRQ